MMLRHEFIFLSEAPMRQSLSTNLTPGLWLGAGIAIVKVDSPPNKIYFRRLDR